MSDNVTSTSLYMLPGQKVKLSVPFDERASGGFFCWPSTKGKRFKDTDIPKEEIIRGFWVEYSDVGSLEEDSDGVGVLYTHNRMESNAVWFFAATGEVSVCNIVAVAPHAHDSIVAGGPAFGTYFSDDETL